MVKLSTEPVKLTILLLCAILCVACSDDEDKRGSAAQETDVKVSSTESGEASIPVATQATTESPVMSSTTEGPDGFGGAGEEVAMDVSVEDDIGEEYPGQEEYTLDDSTDPDVGEQSAASDGSDSALSVFGVTSKSSADEIRIESDTAASDLADEKMAASGRGVSASDRLYVVKPGDTLSGIALAHGTSVDLLVDLNNLADRDALSIGQELRIQ